ncbi:MAG TPA: PP2C family protein-serine/threonine phosphatase [Bryobacteraceae bacterium]
MNLLDPFQTIETTGQAPARVGGIDYYGQCRPAGELHSDFFDFVQFEESLLFFLGDVAGYGQSSKMIAGGIGNLLRSRKERGLKGVMEEINRAVCDLSPNGLYVTLFCGWADVARQQLTYVSAGHEPAILFSQSTGRVRRLESTGTVLGLTARSVYRPRTLPMEAGDVLAGFTDGITEATGPKGEEFREGGVLRVLLENRDWKAAELCNAILSAVERFGGAEPADDQTVAVVRLEHRVAWQPLRREAEEAQELAMAAA